MKEEEDMCIHEKFHILASLHANDPGPCFLTVGQYIGTTDTSINNMSVIES